MTTYTKTDNYALNLYGDTDPADLRDGYNGSMRTIDSTLETHLNRIEGVESRETHDGEVVKALIGDNTVDSATAAKAKWDKASTDAAAATSKADSNTGLLGALGADTTDHATDAKVKWDKASSDAIAANMKADTNTSLFTALGVSSITDAERFAQNVDAFTTAESIGCKANDPDFDNTPVLNAYFNADGKNLVFSKGEYYFGTPIIMQEPSTVLFTGFSHLHVAPEAALDKAITITSNNRYIQGRSSYINLNVTDNGKSSVVLHVNNVFSPIIFDIAIDGFTHTGLKTENCSGLKGDVKVVGVQDTMAEVGIDIGSTDDAWNAVTPVNCKKGVVVHGGGGHYNTIHPWRQSNKNGYQLVGLELAAKSVTIDNYINDALDIGVTKTNGSMTIGSYISYAHSNMPDSVEITGNGGGGSIYIANAILELPAKKFVSEETANMIYIRELSPWSYDVTAPNINDTDVILPLGDFIVKNITEGTPLLKATANLHSARISKRAVNDGSTTRYTAIVYATDGIHYAFLSDGIIKQNTNWKHLLFS